MIIWGVSAFSHDASIAVLKDNKIVFAAHSERYSRVKNDGELNHAIVQDALQYGSPDKVIYYERPLLKKTRQLRAGQFSELFTRRIKSKIREYIDIDSKHIHFSGHHRSHAAAGYFTSKFDNAAIVVVDSIGEWDTTTIWEANGNKLSKIKFDMYPHSIGLWYSAMTQRCGLKPNEEEYILMGMSAFGDQDKLYHDVRDDFFTGDDTYQMHNLHRGALWWRHDFTDVFDIAAATQRVFEEKILGVISEARKLTNSNNLVLMGGCALNCVANSKIAESKEFENIWIMPNPGDAGSSIGAILSYTNKHVEWDGPYLGHEIAGDYPVDDALELLLKNQIFGIANGRAEFGPRALGNRSLIADPRGTGIKDRVNQYKKREEFRPFAPVILHEWAHDYFDLPVYESPHMSFVAKCKYPKQFPAIVHVDGTSRVQTVKKHQHPELYDLLRAFYTRTGCPMILNTSLNVKGEPLVNSEDDAKRFEAINSLPVLLRR